DDRDPTDRRYVVRRHQDGSSERRNARRHGIHVVDRDVREPARRHVTVGGRCGETADVLLTVLEQRVSIAAAHLGGDGLPAEHGGVEGGGLRLVLHEELAPYETTLIGHGFLPWSARTGAARRTKVARHSRRSTGPRTFSRRASS